MLATDRLLAVVAAVGALSLLLFAAALAFHLAALVAWAVAFCGAEYAVFLGVRGDTVDPWAPLVAAALFVAAELGCRAAESARSAPEAAVVLRSSFWLFGGALGAAALGAVLLAAAGGARSGLALEALGVAATVAALAVVVGVVSRAER